MAASPVVVEVFDDADPPVSVSGSASESGTASSERIRVADMKAERAREALLAQQLKLADMEASQARQANSDRSRSDRSRTANVEASASTTVEPGMPKHQAEAEGSLASSSAEPGILPLTAESLKQNSNSDVSGWAGGLRNILPTIAGKLSIARDPARPNSLVPSSSASWPAGYASAPSLDHDDALPKTLGTPSVVINQVKVDNINANTLIDQSRHLEVIHEQHHAHVTVLVQQLQQEQFEKANAQAIADQQHLMCNFARETAVYLDQARADAMRETEMARETAVYLDQARADATREAEMAREALRVQQARGTSESLAANEQFKVLTSQLAAERMANELKSSELEEQRKELVARQAEADRAAKDLSAARQAEADRVERDLLNRQRAELAQAQSLHDAEMRGRALQEEFDRCLKQASPSRTLEATPVTLQHHDSATPHTPVIQQVVHSPNPVSEAQLLEMQTALAFERERNGKLSDELVVSRNHTIQASTRLNE